MSTTKNIIETMTGWTATRMFLPPLLQLPRKQLTLNGIVNCYIKDEVRNEPHERAVYILFRPKESDDFEDFVKTHRAKIIDEYDYGKYVMLVFQYEKKWENDIALIMEGKFSKTSREFQQLVPKTVTITQPFGLKSTEITSAQYSIYKKTAEYREYWNDLYGLSFSEDDEVWPFYKEREIFTQEKLDKLL